MKRSIFLALIIVYITSCGPKHMVGGTAAIRQAIMLDVIGNDPNMGPCEQPGELIKAVQRAYTNSYLTGYLIGLTVSLIIVSVY